MPSNSEIVDSNSNEDQIQISETSIIDIDDAPEKEQAGIAARVAKGVGFAAKTISAVAEEAARRGSGAVEDAVSSASETMLQMRKDRYNPIFPSELYSPGFDMPDLIVLEDGDQRKGIDVCEGAVGWLSIEQKMEVLHLYFSEVPQFTKHFYPMPKLRAAYYKDTYDDSRYIDVANYVDTMEQDYFTELRNTAYLLGAKKCQLESSEEVAEAESREAKAGLKVNLKHVPNLGNVSAGASGDHRADMSQSVRKEIRFTQTFEGNAEPIRPELNRLKHNREIEFFINTRCNSANTNQAKDYICEISTASVICISEEMAGKIDAAVKGVGAAGSLSLKSKVTRELRKKMLFTVEF